MLETAETVYPAIFAAGGTYELLWTTDGVSPEKLRALFNMHAADSTGSTYASAGMMLAVQYTHCLLGPVLHRNARDFAAKTGFMPAFDRFAPEPVMSPEAAKALLLGQPDWQAVLIVGLMLDLQGYPDAKGWVRAARGGHMIKGDVTILEVLVRYLRDCDREGVQYFIGADSPSSVPGELRDLLESLTAPDLEYEILRILSVRAPVDFLLRGHELSSKEPLLWYVFEECARNTGALWATPQQMRVLVDAPWLTALQRDKLQRVWGDRLE